jgi:hypothetical protein
MLRHLIPVSLAITACASLIPIKANAAILTLEPAGRNLRRNPGDSIEFVLALNPNSPGSSGNEVELQGYRLTYDDTELSFVRQVDPIQPPIRFSTARILARYIFNVLPGVRRDGNEDVWAIVNYRENGRATPPHRIGGSAYDVQPVPEPLTIFGTATALGCGVLFKRKSSKKTVS